MVDYVEELKRDLLEQFKGKPVIDALMSAIGRQLNDVRQFYDDLKDRRGVQTAEGKQLDGVGNIAVLSRLEAGEMACTNSSVYVLDDDTYRLFLIYKIWKNTNNCTYSDIAKAFRMFWPKPLYYKEDPAEPATMLFETDDLAPGEDVEKLLSAPFIKAAGVAIKVVAKTVNPEMMAQLPASGIMGRGYMATVLPELELDAPFADTAYPVPSSQNIAQTNLPEIKEE